MTSLMLHELRVRRRAIIWWAFGLAFFSVMYMAFYPGLPEEMKTLDIQSIDIYKSLGVQSMATFEGYMQSTVFNFLPLLVGAFGIVLGTGALAGEEDSGTLELLAAQPVSRLRLYVAKSAAVMIAAMVVTVLVAVIAVAVFVAMESEMDTEVTGSDLFQVMLANYVIALVFTALGLFFGALLPSRGAASAACSAVLVLAFFGNSLSGMVTELEDLQPLSPFSYFVRFTESIGDDPPWEELLGPLAMAVVPLVLGAFAFQRRALTVGAWPWQQAQSGGAAGSRRRSWVAIGLVAVVAIAAVAVAAVAYSDDLELDSLWGDEDATETPSATPLPSATDEDEAAADEEATATPTEDEDEDATPTDEGPAPRATRTSRGGVRPTATLRIGK